MEAPSRVEPLLRWAGGKRQILQKLLDKLPADVADRRYFEPFLGAGSMFFALRPKVAIISDSNAHLIQCYEAVRDHSQTVARYLLAHKSRHSKRHYYSVRSQYNLSRPSASQAARFIYLNQACFNGLFRVNRSGHFNVPWGDKIRPRALSLRELVNASQLLRSAVLKTTDYEAALSAAVADDFAYLDPPYPPLNGTAYFTHYTMDRFDVTNQRRLAEGVRNASARGVLFMMSNADTELIRDLYSGFSIEPIPVTRYVTCKKKKHRVSEVIITNYLAP